MTQPRSSNRTPESHPLWGAAFISAILHAGALAAAFIVWPQMAPPLLLPSDIVPVDLEIADETNVMAQEKAPEPQPEPEQLPMPEMAASEMSMPEPPPPPPDEEGFALDENKDAPKPQEQKPQPRYAMVQPRVKPKPDAKKKEEFDIDKISNLVNKIDEKKASTEDREGAKPQSSKSVKGAGAQTAMTSSEVDAFKSQLRKCWKVDPGAPDPAALVFRVRIFLNQDGTVSAPPELIDTGGLGDPYFRAAVDSAKRAVLMCSPFQLPAEKYDSWNDITITFDPTKMAGY